MALSLYDVSVPVFTQTLTALVGVVDKAEAFCKEKGLPPNALLEARLIDDMLPFNAQIARLAGNSAGSLLAMQKGVIGPDMSPPPETFAALKSSLTDAIATLGRLTPADVNALQGGDMRFEVPNVIRMDFTAENFLLSFVLPNFFFHATTAYDIARHKGVPVGKRDFLGPMRLKA